jgi:heterodisulfide reductase subunit C
MNLALAGLSYGITVVALALLAVRTKKLIGIYKKGQPDSTRGNDKAQRFKMAFGEIFGHTKMFNFSVVGLAHWFVMVGFFVLFGTLVTAYGQLIDPRFALPFIGHFWVYEYITELIAWATGIGIVALIGIRQVTLRTNKRSRFAGSGNGKAYYVEATILLIVFCVIALRGLEGALSDETAWNRHFITTWFIAVMFKSMTLTQLENWVQIVATIKIVGSMAWFIVIASNLTMGIAWHRFLAPFNIFFRRNADGKSSLGALPAMMSHGKEIDFEDPKEDDVFGLGTRADISWKGLLDMSTCTECGRCQSQCPAWHTEKPLSPKLLIMAMRDHAFAKTVENEALVGENSPISLDVLWSCTTCGACVNECPVDIEHVDHIVNMRRFQVLVESEFPSELGGTFRNLERPVTLGVQTAQIAKHGLLNVISQLMLSKANFQKRLNTCSGLVVPALTKNVQRKQQRLWPNFCTWLELTLLFLARRKHVPEILRVVQVMSSYIKFLLVKTLKPLKKLLEIVQRGRRRLLLLARIVLQQSVAITVNKGMNLKWFTTLSC